jgi:hypothetical protein
MLGLFGLIESCSSLTFCKSFFHIEGGLASKFYADALFGLPSNRPACVAMGCAVQSTLIFKIRRCSRLHQCWWVGPSAAVALRRWLAMISIPILGGGRACCPCYCSLLQSGITTSRSTAASAQELSVLYAFDTQIITFFTPVRANHPAWPGCLTCVELATQKDASWVYIVIITA